jgi:hypothetical protein
MPQTDSDFDGMPDYWESWHNLGNAGGDADGDGVTEVNEYRRGSDPFNKDKSASMNVVRSITGWTSNPSPMRWDSDGNQWELLLWNPGNPAQEFKFLAGNGTDWGQKNWGDGFADPFQSPDGVADSGGQNIAHQAGGNSNYAYFAFDEVWGGYFAGPISTLDENNDGIADDWAEFHGISSAGGNSDGDAWNNIAEFQRRTNPVVNDGGQRRMSVTGNTAPLPFWEPAANNMAWSEQRARWEWSGNFTSNTTIEFKFSQATQTGNWSSGPSWGNGTTPGVAVAGAGGNLQASVSTGRHLIHFNDLTGRFGVEPFPASLAWLESNQLSSFTGNPWRADSDADGFNNLLEYAAGGSPNQRNAAGTMLPQFQMPSSGGNMTIQFVLRTDNPKLRHFLESSSNLAGAWTSNATGTNSPFARFVSSNSTGLSAGLSRFTYEAPSAAGASRFYRIKSELQP